MNVHSTFLKSRVARRIVILFITCALLPISLLAFISYKHVTDQLRDQTHKRLHQTSKALGMSIYERLLNLEVNLTSLVSSMQKRPINPGMTSFELETNSLTAKFVSLTLLKENEDAVSLKGPIRKLGTLTEPEWQHLMDGKTLLSFSRNLNNTMQILMIRRVNTPQIQGYLMGDIDLGYLWRLEDESFLPSENLLDIVDKTTTLVGSSGLERILVLHQISRSSQSNRWGYFNWQNEDIDYLAGYWTLPLEFNFYTSGWTLVISEPTVVAFGPLEKFSYSFVLVLLLSLLIVAFLSLNQIRRSLGPLELLKQGTERIAKKDFRTPVQISSGDEFEHLASSFNAMTDQIRQQFQILATLSEIDRTILSSLHTKTIIDVVLSRIPDVLHTDQASITLLDERQPDTWQHVVRRYSRYPNTITVHSPRSSTDIEAFNQHQDHLLVQQPNLPSLISPLIHQDLTAFLLLPIVRSGECAGFIALGYVVLPALTEEDLTTARQLTNQVAIALANATDVAERKKAEAALQDKNQALQEALAELKSTQHQIVQQERLRALGQMASGIAHDFNNTLTPIVGFTELMLMNPKSLDNPEKARDLLRLIHTAGQDAAKVVSRLRDFYRPRNSEEEVLAPVQLNQLVSQAILLTQPRWKDQALAQGSTLSIATDLQDIPEISGNEAELREVLINLIFNAVDASPESGTITIRTYLKEQQVIMEVTDTGKGMTEEVRQKCLEPFFSTKGDRGTGLGLSMVFGIIRRHQGIIDVSSVLGQGTTFTLSLPLLNRQEEQRIQPVEQQPLRPLHILMAEDDPLVCTVIMEFLAKDGHMVIAASDGEEALHTFEGGVFDVVITDQGLPKLSGDQLAAAVKHRSPKTPIIMISGIADLLDEESKSSPDIDVILSKPITISDLRSALGKVMIEEDMNASSPQGDTSRIVNTGS